MERQPKNIQLPPGFRFHPSDEELIIYYLRNKAASLPVPASIIAEVDLYKYNPWELPKKALFGEEEWYFFSPRDRKYPNGARPNRAAASGYWKATGTDKPILTSCGLQSIGVKKALVFYEGRPPKGIKTDWIMHEYRLLNTMIKPSRLRGSMRLDDWVLCRVRQKGNMPKNLWDDRDGSHSEPRSFFPNVEKQYPTSTELTLEEVANYLQNDFPESPSILPSQGFPCKETVSIVSFQSGNNGNSSSSIYEDGSEKGNSPIAVSSFDRLFNPLKRIAIEGNQEYEPLPCKMVINNEDHYMNHVSSSSKPNNNNSYNNTGLNFCRQFQAQDNVFSSNPLNPILDIQELSQLAFTERDLH